MKKSSRIFIAGHSGFVGNALTQRLKALGFKNLILKTHQEIDLTDQAKVNKLFKAWRPEYVFLLAAKVGGIRANNTYPADFIYQNVAIQANVIQAAYEYKAKKLIFPGSACMFPKYCSQPMKEDSLLTGPIEPTNEPFAVAKIAGVKMCQAYNRQYKTDFISVVPATIYGPGDHFDINGHVMAALIEKFSGKEVNVWGSGKPKREFIFIDDLASALIFLMQNYNGSQIINIGTGIEISIKNLAQKIKEITLFKGKLTFDRSKPDGMPRRLLDSSALLNMGWQPKVNLERGIKLTYEWYKSKHNKIKKE
ncbi:MAG: GDP-fucose synthetase [Candidatus Omnitrophica bacterium CG11_big_fil_rev_8_21_14_0_20_43_6]|nr:MAG: GDP-fucose synthetase [Candidatus Omnitrophica bacterium CG11_big_fil_rev_8_21_14_0_20_43_6]